MLAEVAGPEQRAAKKMRPGHCTKKIHPGCPGLTFLGPIHSFTKVSHPSWKYICSRAIVHLRQTQLAQANYMFQCRGQNEKKRKGTPKKLKKYTKENQNTQTYLTMKIYPNSQRRYLNYNNGNKCYTKRRNN